MKALCGPRADSGGDAMLPVAFLKGIPNKDLGGMCAHSPGDWPVGWHQLSEPLISLTPR